MHRLSAVILAALLGAGPLAAQDTTTVDRRLERMQRQIDSLRAESERQQNRIMELDARGAAAPEAPRDTVRRGMGAQGIYGKPFVRRFGSGTAVGGYVDVEYRQDLTNGVGAFDQHRLVPFIFSEITDRLHFGTEIEFEHGVKHEIEGGAAEGFGEINVEFATLDYAFQEAFNLRAGLILSPLGRFNLMHDSPVNDLTDRPLVAQEVIPGTLTEAGAGFFGTLYPSEQSLLTYEAYVVNGFTDELLPATLTGAARLNIRDAAGTRGADGSATKNFVGRLGFSPFLGLELGASLHWGAYGDGVGADPQKATILAFDGVWQHGPFEVLGEAARLKADLPASYQAAGVSDGRQGFYLQGNYHFGHGVLAPKQSSVFTGVVRLDQVDRATGAEGDQLRRLTAGLNWRPVEDAAFKTEYQWNWSMASGGSTWDTAPRRLLFSLATYF